METHRIVIVHELGHQARAFLARLAGHRPRPDGEAASYRMEEMTTLLAAVAALSSKLTAEGNEFATYKSHVQDLIDAAVTKALTDHGVEDDAVAEAVAEATATVDQHIADIQAAEGEGSGGSGLTDTSTGSDTAANTVAGGQGDDSVAAGSGSDSQASPVTDGNIDPATGLDTTSAGDTSTGSSSAGQDTLQTGGGQDTLNDGAAANTVAGGQGDDATSGT